MDNDLRAAVNDMSEYISLEVGDSFQGIYKGFKRVVNRFDSEKETLEFTFEVNGNDKSMTSMSISRALLEADVAVGDNLQVTKVSKKGNAVIWSVLKIKNKPSAVAKAPVPVEVPEVDLASGEDTLNAPTEEDLAKAGI